MSTEKVKIAEIDIGVDKLMAKTGQVKKQIAELSDEQKKLKDSTKGLKDATAEQLEQFTRNEIEMKKLKKENSDSIKVLEAYINIQNQDIKTKQQARDANLKLIAIANQLDATNEDQAAILKKVNKEIDDNTEFIKMNASEYEKTKIGIGNYKEAIKGALGELGIFGDVQGKVNNITSAGGPIINFLSTNLKQVKEDYKKTSAETYGMSKAQIAAHLTSTTLSAGLKLLRLALIATGIGAFVVVVGSLLTYLSKTQAGIDLVNKVLAGAGAAFDVIIDRVAKFGQGIMKFLSGDIKGGIEGITGAFEGMGDEIQREIDLAMELEEVLQNVEKAEVNLDIRRAAANTRLKELKKTSEDASKSTADRIKAAEEFAKIEEGLVAEEVANQEKRVAAMLGFAEVTDEVRDKIRLIGEEGVALKDLGISESTVEDMKEFKDQVVNLFDLQGSSYERQTENQNKLNTLKNESIKTSQEAVKAELEKQKELMDVALKRQEIELQMYIEKQGIAAKTLSEELALAENVFAKEIDIEKQKLAAKKITQEEFELFVLQKDNELAQKRAEIAVSNAERELEIFKASHQSKVDANQFLNEELFQQERDRLDAIAEAEREFQAQRLNEGIIHEEEYNAAIAAVNAQNHQDQETLRLEREEAKKEKDVIDLENSRALEEENWLTKFDLESQKLEEQRLAEIAAAEKTGADITLINKKFAKLQEDIEFAKHQAKVKMAADTLGSISSVLGEETALGKAAALAQALMNTYLGITAGVKLGWPAMIPAVAAASATGFGAVKNITKTKTPRAEEGIIMDIKGKSHSQGGETFYDAYGNPIVEAQGGEKMVILKREASRELDVLSRLNQKYGGVSLSTPVTYANNGGAVIRNPSIAGTNVQIPKDLFDYNLLGNVLADKVNSIQQVVAVDQITDIAARAAIVESRASF